jgi:peptide/nickel transport system permease protein
MLGTYIIRRLLQSILVVFGVTFISFGLIFISGDPAILMLPPQTPLEEIEAFREAMGFDQPWYLQYIDFMSRAVQGDFGTSLRHGQPSTKLVLERMPATLQLAFTSLLISVVLAVPLGIISATQRGTIYDNLSMFGALIGQSMPNFWLGIMFILIFGVRLRWLPISGRGDFSHLVLPALTLAVFPLARNTRLIRSSLLEVLGQDYLRTARAKGLTERAILIHHGLRNALIPVVTVVGMQFGTLLGGAVITETIFAWPGVGRLTVHSIYNKDFPVIQASVTILALSFILINLLVDILYTHLDPRIRLA